MITLVILGVTYDLISLGLKMVRVRELKANDVLDWNTIPNEKFLSIKHVGPIYHHYWPKGAYAIAFHVPDTDRWGTKGVILDGDEWVRIKYDWAKNNAR